MLGQVFELINPMHFIHYMAAGRLPPSSIHHVQPTSISSATGSISSITSKPGAQLTIDSFNPPIEELITEADIQNDDDIRIMRLFKKRFNNFFLAEFYAPDGNVNSHSKFADN